MAADDPKYTAAVAQSTWSKVRASITPPVRQMKPESPRATPWSMISALSRGRKSAANACRGLEDDDCEQQLAIAPQIGAQ